MKSGKTLYIYFFLDRLKFATLSGVSHVLGKNKQTKKKTSRMIAEI